MAKKQKFGPLGVFFLILAILVFITLPFAIISGLQEGIFTGSLKSALSGAVLTLTIGVLFTAPTIFWEPVWNVVVAKFKGESPEK